MFLLVVFIFGIICFSNLAKAAEIGGGIGVSLTVTDSNNQNTEDSSGQSDNSDDHETQDEEDDEEQVYTLDYSSDLISQSLVEEDNNEKNTKIINLGQDEKTANTNYYAKYAGKDYTETKKIGFAIILLVLMVVEFLVLVSLSKNTKKESEIIQ